MTKDSDQESGVKVSGPGALGVSGEHPWMMEEEMRTVGWIDEKNKSMPTLGLSLVMVVKVVIHS